MNPFALAISFLGAMVAYVVITFVDSWWVRRSAKRAMDRVLLFNPTGGTGTPSRLTPEASFVVRITDADVACSRPDGSIESVRWDDLQRVELLDNGQGPMVPDVFWVLHGTSSGCVVPQGATGEQQLLARLQALPGFDNGAVIDAMVTATPKRMLCWSRPGEGNTPPKA